MDKSDIEAVKQHVEYQLSDLLDFLAGIEELEDLRNSIESARQKAE